MDYTYSISESTLNKKVNTDRLKEEILASGIPYNVYSVMEKGDQLIIVLGGTLTSSQHILLTQTVENHDGSPITTPQLVEILEERSYRSQGNYQLVMWKYSIPEQSPGNESYLEAKSYPFHINALSLEWRNSPEVNGDEMAFLVDPDRVVGVLTSSAVVGDSTIKVNPTVIEDAQVGYVYTLETSDPSLPKSQHVGRAIQYDTVENTLTFEYPLESDYTFSEEYPVYIKRSIEFSPKIYLLDQYINEMGSTRIGGSFIPKNTDMVVKYKNMDGRAKNLYILMEYLY